MITEAKKDKRLEAAMHAHTNLNTFGTIIAILEGGTLHGPTKASSGRTARKIIALCKAETQRQLALMDRATGRVDPRQKDLPL